MPMITYSLQQFFSKKFEVDSTNLLYDNPSYFSRNAMIDYLCQLSQRGLAEYVYYMLDNPISEEITSKDITQLSNINDCTINMCKVLMAERNRGLTLTQIATALHSDLDYKNNLVALTKYGENQAKTAAQLGLAVFREELWYLSAVGYVFIYLNEEVQNKYLAINLLRDPFYSRVIASMCSKETNIRDFMGILSESTQKRRSSSCNWVIAFFTEQCRREQFKVNRLIFK